MAEEIVACPGCAKKFRIPEGAESGSFPCTACGVDVPYGAAARKPAARSAARPAPRAAAPAAQPARAVAPAPKVTPARRAVQARQAVAARRHADDDDAPKKSNAALWWTVGVAGAGALIWGVWSATKPAPATTPTTTAAAKAPTPVKPPETKPVDTKPAETKPTTPPTSTEPPVSTTENPKPADTKPAPTKTDPVEVKKAPEPAVAKPTRGSGTVALIGHDVESVPGTTDEERASMDKLVVLAMNLSSGKEGSDAEARLVRMGKKAVPPLLSAFSKQYSAGKWAKDDEQYGADKVQYILHDIVGDDGPFNQRNPDFWPRFMSGAPPEDFEKAAGIWLKWWNETGQFMDKFKKGK